jgi:hypothetical protein
LSSGSRRKRFEKKKMIEGVEKKEKRYRDLPSLL